MTKDVRSLTATQHRQIANDPGSSTDDLVSTNKALHLLVADLLDIHVEAMMIARHWQHLHPSNAIGDVWIDVAEVCLIQTRVAKFQRISGLLSGSRA